MIKRLLKYEYYMSMLPILKEVESILPSLLVDEGWNSVFADTEKPHLRRLWRPYGPHRINLHHFSECEPSEEFPHPHPWQMAVRILEGSYSMSIGRSSDPNVLPIKFEQKIFRPGDSYEMLDADEWHALRPLGTEVLSLMVSGPPIYPQNRKRANTPVRELFPDERQVILERFKRHYRN